MYKGVISKVEAVGRNFVQRRLLPFRKTVSRFMSQTSVYIVFELLILVGILSSIGIIAASQWSTRIIASHGNLRVDGVGVYNDRNCSTATTYLDWGTLKPGSSSNITVYIRNEGNQATTLLLNVDNWSPANTSNYMTVSWTFDGRMLSPNDIIEVIFSLYVSPDVENIVDFSFDVIIGVNA